MNPTHRLCSLPNCKSKHKANGYCEKHYQRIKKWGTTEKPPARRCSLANCGEIHESRGLCKRHYDASRNNGDPLKITRIYGENRTSHPLYNTHRSMIRRCHYKEDKAYENYGGRGIKVCERWREPLQGFPNFLADMGERPEGYSLDRIDNDGNYEPSNCRWATRTEQNCNQRLRKDNKTGLVGVYFCYGKYITGISFKGKHKHLGTFNTAKEARQAYEKAKQCRDFILLVERLELDMELLNNG